MGCVSEDFSQDGPPELKVFIGALETEMMVWIVTASTVFYYEHGRFVLILFEGRRYYRICRSTTAHTMAEPMFHGAAEVEICRNG